MDPDNHVNKAMVRGPNNLHQCDLSDWIDKPSADLPTEAEKSQAATAGKDHVQSEAKREKEWRKDCTDR